MFADSEMSTVVCVGNDTYFRDCFLTLNNWFRLTF